MADASTPLTQTTLPAIAPVGMPAATTVAPQNNTTPSAVSRNGYNAATSTAAQVAPTLRNVDSNQTVQGQLGSLINSGSPFIQQARAQADMNMNSRGLLNSSIAEGAADSAAYSAAMPIAQQDANTFSQAASNNQAVQNQTSQFNAGQATQVGEQNASNINQASNAGLSANTNIYNTNVGRDVSLSNAATSAASQKYSTDIGATTSLSNAATGAASQKYSSDVSANTAIQNAQLSATTQTALANLDAGTKMHIQNLSNQNSQLLQSSQSAASAFNLYMNTVAQISQSTTMGADAKNTAMQNAYANINQQFQVIGQISGINISKYFTTSGQSTPQAGMPQTGGPDVPSSNLEFPATQFVSPVRTPSPLGGQGQYYTTPKDDGSSQTINYKGGVAYT